MDNNDESAVWTKKIIVYFSLDASMFFSWHLQSHLQILTLKLKLNFKVKALLQIKKVEFLKPME